MGYFLRTEGPLSPTFTPLFVVNADTPDTANEEFYYMLDRWHLPQTLLGGTFEMRAAGEKYLPRNIKESDTAYARRLTQSVLTPIFANAVNNVVAKPFSRAMNPLDFKGPIVQDLYDIDLLGNSMDTFARDVFKDAWSYGKSHVLATFPSLEEDTPRNRKFQEENKIRPYLKHLKANQVFAWRHKSYFGQPVLTVVRWFEYDTVEKNEFSNQVDVLICEMRLTDGGVYKRVWRKDMLTGTPNLESEGFVLNGKGNPLTSIPLRTFYTNRVAPMIALPPLEDVAYMNGQHWIAGSDQMNIVSWIRVPLLVAQGTAPAFPDGTEERPPLDFGTNQIYELPPGGSMNFIEHSGASIEAGRVYMKDLEEQARIAGLEVLVSNRRSGNITATEQALNASQAHSSVKQSVVVLEDMLEHALEDMAQFYGNPDSVSVGNLQLNKDFSVGDDKNQDMAYLFQQWQAGLITSKTLLSEAQRRNILSDEVVVEDELNAASAKMPPLPQTNDLDDLGIEESN